MEPIRPNSSMGTPSGGQSINVNRQSTPVAPASSPTIFPKTPMASKNKSPWPAILLLTLFIILILGGSFYWWSNKLAGDLRNEADSKFQGLTVRVDDLQTEVDSLQGEEEIIIDTKPSDIVEDETTTEDATETTKGTPTDETNTTTTDETTSSTRLTYADEDYKFTFTYPSEYEKLAEVTPWIYKTGLEKTNNQNQYTTELTANLSLSAKTTEANYYPTLKVNVFDLENYAFSIPPGNEYIYDALMDSWVRNDGTTEEETMAEKVTVGEDLTGYKLRFNDADGNYYSINAIPLLDQGIMVEIGFSGTDLTENVLDAEDILSTFAITE